MDHDTGSRTQIEVHKRLKPWRFIAENSKLGLGVRYGARVLEPAKGKFSVKVPNEQEMATPVELLK